MKEDKIRERHKNETDNAAETSVLKRRLTPMEVALSVVRDDVQSDIVTDPQGSWTGVPTDKNDLPVQDADDL